MLLHLQVTPTLGGAVTTGSTQKVIPSEEQRVECVVLTKDNRYVITGASSGPPQVWDMKVGTDYEDNIIALAELQSYIIFRKISRFLYF